MQENDGERTIQQQDNLPGERCGLGDPLMVAAVVKDERITGKACAG